MNHDVCAAALAGRTSPTGASLPGHGTMGAGRGGREGCTAQPSRAPVHHIDRARRASLSRDLKAR